MESWGDGLRSMLHSAGKTDPKIEIPGLFGNVPRRRLVEEFGNEGQGRQGGDVSVAVRQSHGRVTWAQAHRGALGRGRSCL